mmetsp:Transcript_96917/g.163092  ORF Transcript_96917/g.163092 Transcript_96917/m.163092 type:complete len:203 (-) Transcript_96917:1112-1720(-)
MTHPTATRQAVETRPFCGLANRSRPCMDRHRWGPCSSTRWLRTTSVSAKLHKSICRPSAGACSQRHPPPAQPRSPRQCAGQPQPPAAAPRASCSTEYPPAVSPASIPRGARGPAPGPCLRSVPPRTADPRRRGPPSWVCRTAALWPQCRRRRGGTPPRTRGTASRGPRACRAERSIPAHPAPRPDEPNPDARWPGPRSGPGP